MVAGGKDRYPPGVMASGRLPGPLGMTAGDEAGHPHRARGDDFSAPGPVGSSGWHAAVAYHRQPGSPVREALAPPGPRAKTGWRATVAQNRPRDGAMEQSVDALKERARR